MAGNTTDKPAAAASEPVGADQHVAPNTREGGEAATRLPAVPPKPANTNFRTVVVDGTVR